MKGNNTLTLCQSAACEAIQYWAEREVFHGKNIKVTSVRGSKSSPSSNSYDTFEITVTDEADDTNA